MFLITRKVLRLSVVTLSMSNLNEMSDSEGRHESHTLSEQDFLNYKALRNRFSKASG